MFLWAIPLITFSIVAVSSPITNVLFIIDENNLYIRSAGVYFHWLVTWMYLIFATLQVAHSIYREKNVQKRKEIIPFLYFIIAPTIAGMIQMLFYGVTSSQVGVTISIIIISLIENRNQILTDGLTGLNNRNGLDKYIQNHILSHSDNKLFLFMIDLDNFKQINDKFGHITGDRALVDVAVALKQVCEEAPVRLFVCRYGGDEDDFAYLLRMADEAMYDEKKHSKCIDEK